MSEQKLREIAQTIMSLSKADQAEVALGSGESTTMRFANNAIHQPTSQFGGWVKVRLVYGKKVGVASGNQFDRESLAAVVAQAEEICRYQQDDPGFVSLPASGPARRFPPGKPSRGPLPGGPPTPVTRSQSIRTYDEQTAQATPQKLAKKAAKVIDQAKKQSKINNQQLVASGQLTRSVGETAVANSLGVWVYRRDTEVNLSTVVQAVAGPARRFPPGKPTGSRGYPRPELGSKAFLGDPLRLSPAKGGSGDFLGSGFASDLGWRLDQIQEEEVAQKAVQKAITSQNPQDLEAGEYEVILEPAAFEELLDYFAWLGPNARIYHENVSYFKGRLGKKVFSELLTVTDDPTDRRGVPAAFDWEGVPKKPTTIVENGVIRNLVYDSYYAQKYRKENTGHALPAPNTFGPLTSHLVISPGKSSLSQMISKVKRGVLVTRLWYIRSVHVGEMLLTGMTRDGTFLIENGEITASVKNLRFTESIPNIFKNIVEIGRELSPHASWGGGANLTPAVRVSKFRFTGRTEY